METDKFKYHVIWIDDKCEELKDFITNANMEGIGVESFKFGKDGLKAFSDNLLYWDGIILDVKCCYEDGDLDTSDSYFRIEKEMRSIILKNRPELPVYVYSGQPDIINNKMFESYLGECKMYVKGSDDDDLLKDIVSNAQNLPETKLRLKYLQGIPNIGLDNELLEMLSIVEKEDSTNADFFNKARRTLEQVMRFCNDVGILPVRFNGSNLSQCSRFLGKTEMRKYIPIYVQRSFHSAVEVTNNGSHREEVFYAVRSGNAPYLIRSTMFELMNILKWCGSLPVEENDRARIRQDVNKFNTETSIEGEVEKDENGNYHCRECLISYKMMENYGLNEHDIVNIDNTAPNTKQSPTKPYAIIASSIKKI